MHTQAVEDYLKSIYKLQEEQNKVTTTVLAELLEVTPAAATGMIKKLAEMNLVIYERYQGVSLTDAGQKIALEVIRHHRLVELYLAEALGVPWDQVHEEAEKWEHVLSEDLEERMDALLGHPTADPHGAPIPNRDGRIAPTTRSRLTELCAGQSGVVAEVSDHDPALLRYLGNLNLYPKTAFRVVDVAPFNGPVTICVGDAQHALGREVANHIFVSQIRDSE
jgi:DtxR family Mn-dependent transcriptional regulator